MKTLFILIVLFINSALSQNYDGIYDYFFLKRTASAQIEAMGRGGVALHGTASSAFFNPAGIGTITDYKLNYTNSSSYFLLDNSEINYFAVAFQILDYGTIGLTYNNFDFGYSITTTSNEASSNSNSYMPYLSNTALTYAYSFSENFFTAFTVNYFTEGFTKTFHSLNYDFGALLFIETGDFSKFSLGLSFKNIINQKIEEETISNIETGDDRTPYYIGIPERYLPVQLIFGISYENDELIYEIIPETQTLGFLVHTEIQTVLNSEYYDAKRIGAELTIFETLDLRVGYYHETINDYGYSEYNDDYVEDYTYGFGLNLDFNKYFELPFTIDFDYTSLEQDINKKSDYFGLLEDYHVISIGLNWLVD